MDEVDVVLECERQLLEHQWLIGVALKVRLLGGESGPEVDALHERWQALEAFRTGEGLL